MLRKVPQVIPLITPFVLGDAFYVIARGVMIALALLLGACARPAAISPVDAFRETSVPPLSDDLQLSALYEAIQAQASSLKTAPNKIMRIGPESIPHGEYAEALERLATILASDSPLEQKFEYIKDNFRFFDFYGGDRWGEVLLTGYFEPIIRGSLKRTDAFTQPLYKKPEDLITIALGSFSERFKGEKDLKGRIVKGRAVPYYTREAIDGEKALQGKALEIVWVDPVDAFFLHIQGSGTIQLENGAELHVTYADKNGHRYEPIGRFLKDRLAPRKVTAQRIERLLRSMSAAESNQLLFKNPSYVFFNRSSKRALTSLGIPATPGRTIAVDPRFAPKGALAMITFQKPILGPTKNLDDDPVGFEQVSRFVLDQDSGGAITGTNHVDLFWGRGDEAKAFAGILQERATIRYLVPR